MKTAVIYARYSSDLQKDRSIDDQIALCKEIALRNGYTVADIFSDRAKSGASMFERDGLLALMNAAKKRDFNAVICESLSRLSRDQEDTAAIYKRLKFNEITIIDSGGLVSDVHVGVGGIVNSMFLKNLAVSVKRSLDARAREGLVPGRVAFGLRCTGKKCEREIDPAAAAIVLRFFEEYADGKSIVDITDDLKRENIATPRLSSEFLRNEIYIGKIVRNVTSSVKDPDTGRRLFRRGAVENRIVVEAPELRIIPQELWNRVQHLLTARKKDKGWHGPRQHKFVNKDHLLLGLLTCGKCGGAMMIGQNNPDGSPRMVCSFGYRREGCDHRRSYCLKTLQNTILNGIRHKLTNRKALLELTRAYHERWAERQRTVRGDFEKAKKQLNRVTVQIDRIVTAISDSDDPVKVLMGKLKMLEIERAGLAEKVRLIEAEGTVITLHPAAIGKFADSMEEIHTALTGDLDIKELAPFRSAFRNTFERIVVHPTDKKKPYEVTPYARLAAIMGLELFPKMRSAAEMLAEQGGSGIKNLPGSCW
jgi:site-specific DNA recombinase